MNVPDMLEFLRFMNDLKVNFVVALIFVINIVSSLTDYCVRAKYTG